MGGSSSQVTGYRYFANFLLFIGNPIEQLIAINFDKRGWMTGRRVEIGDSGELIHIEAQDIYGENEGGVYGVVNLHKGTDFQLPDEKYSQYMESIGLKASAYPYQSYLSFSGSGKVNTGNGWIDGVFGALAGYMNDAFYVGNSGYMKEMLLWPKRIHVRNDGREQWYDAKAEIPEGGGIELPSGPPTTEPLDIPNGISITRNLTVGDDLIISAPEAGDIADKTLRFWGGGWNTSSTLDLKSSSFTSVAHLPYSRWIGTIKIKTKGGGEAVSVTGSTYSHIDDVGYEVYNIDFTGEVFGISIDVSETIANEWSYLNLQRFYAPPPKIDSGDINPIHKIREILTDDTAMNKPETSVNNENFMKAADRIWKEGLGISWSITEKSCIDAINELCYHIEAGIRVNRQTGLYEMVLFRDDWFEENEIHVIAENKIKKGSMQYEITNADEVINQVNVNYYDRKNIKNSSFSIPESGLIQTIGRVNAETVDFPYFMNIRNAEIVANWKLKILSTGVLKGSFTTGWREARKWNRYDLLRLPWSNRWTGTILVRIMSIKLGGPTSNEVSIEWVEVVPSTRMMNTTIVADDPVNTQPETPKPCNTRVFELPYFEAVQTFGEREVGIELTDNPEAGYLCTIAEKPQNNSLNAALHVDSGNGFERVATVNYCETAYLDQAIDRISSAFVVKNVGNIASIRLGSQIFINDETMVYQSYDATTKVLTVKRGALDSVPQNHAANSILYFADDFVAVDQTLYVHGEIINAKVLTTTPSGVLALSDAVNHEVEFNARAIRPYPPANVKINGKYWPAYFENDLVISWVNRNRLQQTGGEIIGYFEPGVTLEASVNCQLILTEFDENNIEIITQNANVTAVNTFTLLASSMNPNTRKIKFVLKTIRDGFECLYPFEHSVLVSNLTAPTGVNFEVIEI